jgi:hypothetical protein
MPRSKLCRQMETGDRARYDQNARMTITPDRSILDDGRVLFSSADRFLREIINGDNCFICGSKAGSVPFNDEHVIPDWILRRHDLHDKRIIIPGGSELTYGRYKVPCCAQCNSRMGDVLERPISELVSSGYAAILRNMVANPMLVYVWLNIIFLKTHLKDRALLINRDTRAASGRISELYDWPEMHCVARTFYSGAGLSVEALESIFILPAKTGSDLGDFDYADYYPGRAMLLRIGEIAFICVLNDACGTLTLLEEDMRRINRPLPRCSAASFSRMLHTRTYLLKSDRSFVRSPTSPHNSHHRG